MPQQKPASRKPFANINSAVVSANSQVKALSTKFVNKRQGSTKLATLIENLILDISGALNSVNAKFGLSMLLVTSSTCGLRDAD